MAGRPRVRTTVNRAEVDRLTRTTHYVDALERGAADGIVARAQRDAPVSRTGSHGQRPGHLRRGIVKRRKLTADGYVIRIVSTARTPSGFPYGVVQQQRRPYIRPLNR